MRKIFLFYFVLCGCLTATAQELSPGLKQKIAALKTITGDTAKISLLGKIIDEAPDGVWEKYNEQLKTISVSLIDNKNPEISRAGKTGLANALNNEGYFWDTKGNLKEALEYYKKSLEIRESLKDYPGIAQSYNNIATLYQSNGDIPKAIEFFNLSLSIRIRMKDKEGMANSYLNLGYLSDKLGDFSKALEYYQKSLKFCEEINDKKGMAGVLINIGIILDNNLDEPEKAMMNYRKSIPFSQQVGDKENEAKALNNIGVVFQKQAAKLKKVSSPNIFVTLKTDSALYYFRKSLKIREGQQYEVGIAHSFNCIGEVYEFVGDLQKAEEFYLKSLLMREKLGDKKDLAFSLVSTAGIYYKLGDHFKSKKYALEALKISNELGFPDNIGRSAEVLNNLYYAEGDYKGSLTAFKLYIRMRDSIQNQEAKKEMVKQQFQFEYESKVHADSIVAAQEKRVVNARFKQEQTQRYALYGGVSLLLVFGGVMYNRFRITRKQKQIIQTQMNWVQEQKEMVDEQKQLVDKKNKEILSSIEYAKRIQATILPPVEEVEKLLPDSFVLYLPKDIVAGDFYWMKQVQPEDSKIGQFENEKGGANEKNQPFNPSDSIILIAACDSTGHGVPGAMVSVVCSKAMDKAVKEFQLSSPSEILDKVAELVIEDFSRNNTKGDEIKDGMDASLLALYLPGFTDPTELVHVEWAGANNSLAIIKPNGELTEIKADKQPIGKTEVLKPFTLQQLELSKGSCLYLYTDGYHDQFGGAKGKKLTKTRFKELLVSISHLPMKKQKEKLQSFLNEYKKSEEQVDDICVIGIRI